MTVAHDFAPVRPPERRAERDALVLFALFTLAAWVAIGLARLPGSVAGIWWANALAVGFMATAPVQRWSSLMLAAAAGNLAANLAHGDGLLVSAAFVPGNVAEVLVAAAALRRFGDLGRFTIDHAAFARVIGFGALLPALVGATIGAAVLQGLGFGRFERVWLDWYVGDALGAAALLPLVLAMRALPHEAWRARLATARSIGRAAAVAVATLAVFHELPYPFVVAMVLLGTCAMTMPRLHAALNAFVFTLVLIASLALGLFAPADVGTPYGHSMVYAAALLVVVPTQMVAVLMARQRAQSEMLAAIGSTGDATLVFADPDGAFRWINHAGAGFWGRPHDQTLGRRWQDNLPEKAYREVFEPLLREASAGRPAAAQALLEVPGGGERALQLDFRPALDEEGHAIGVIGSLVDVTELVRSREQLQRRLVDLGNANERLEQFARIAAHDLREPLNTIRQFGYLIEHRHGDTLPPQVSGWLGHMMTGAQRMANLLDDVMRFVRLDDGTPLPVAVVPLEQVVGEALQALGARVAERGAQVRADALYSVVGQHELLVLVLQNLIGNAIKFVPPDRTPKVEVEARRRGEQVELCVVDNGIGIPADQIGLLGQPFRRLHSRRMFEGTGLGLATCRRVLERLGGALAIESTLGVGTCVRVRLPAA